MLENRFRRTRFAEVQPHIAFLPIVCMTFLLSAAAPSVAHAQKSGGPAKPLPAKSQPTAFYTPEGQQQIADAILTDAVDQLIEQSDVHFDKGEYNHSVNLLRVVVQGNPRRVDAFADAAFLLWSTGQNDPAIAFLKQGLAANPDDYYMYDELGSFYFMRLKDYPNAVTYYEQAIKFKCPFFTWSGLAHCYEKLNQWDKAVKTWEQSTNYVTDGTTNATMKHNLARAKAELAKRQKE
jgi:tetratricopeptide (TPR) repeat protein